MSNFSETLKKLRIIKGLTQQELSDRIGVSRSAIGMYERGEREPDFETLEAMADFFNVDMNYILGSTHKTTVLHASDELDFMVTYQRLNTSGKARLLEYAMELAEINKYKK